MNKPIILEHTDFYVREKKGFTLLEILLAISVFAILVTTVFGSFNFILKNASGFNDILEIDTMASRCLQRMILDLESIHVTPRPLYALQTSRDVSDIHSVKGGLFLPGYYSEPILRFSSTAHLPIYGSSQNGVAEIIYYLEQTSVNEGVLKRSDRLFSDLTFAFSPKDPIVCEHVTSIKFSFFDNHGNRFDSWDSDSREFNFATPSAIAIFLQVRGKSGLYAFNTMIRLPVVRDNNE